MSTLKLIAFDWDGTLADSIDKIIACKQFLANKYALPSPSVNTIHKVLGMKFEEALMICFPNTARNILDELGREFHVLMQQDNYQADLFPNAREILIMLKERGIKLAVTTSKERGELDKAILHNKLSSMFDITCCGYEYPSKPNPAMLHCIMKKFNILPSECLVIGDTTMDILFSANAGVNAIGVTFGAHSVTELQSANPLALIEQWVQLAEVINRCYSIQLRCPL